MFPKLALNVSILAFILALVLAVVDYGLDSNNQIIRLIVSVDVKLSILGAELNHCTVKYHADKFNRTGNNGISVDDRLATHT